MLVREFDSIDEKYFFFMLRRVRKWIGIRGEHILRRYYNSRSQLVKRHILARVSLLTHQYSLVMTCRFLLLDINHHFKSIPGDFILRNSEQRYIKRQLLRLIGEGVEYPQQLVFNLPKVAA